MSSSENSKSAAYLCCHFVRQFAYYNATLAQYSSNDKYWLTVSGNFIDVCVMEWCKLFGSKSKTNYYHYRNVLGDPDRFKASMLDMHALDEKSYLELWGSIKKYRDEFVAHLEKSENTPVPNMQVAGQLVDHYYRALTNEFPHLTSVIDLPKHIDQYYVKCLNEAKSSAE
jgi:hypothetical protein